MRSSRPPLGSTPVRPPLLWRGGDGARTSGGRSLECAVCINSRSDFRVSPLTAGSTASSDRQNQVADYAVHPLVRRVTLTESSSILELGDGNEGNDAAMRAAVTSGAGTLQLSTHTCLVLGGGRHGLSSGIGFWCWPGVGGTWTLLDRISRRSHRCAVPGHAVACQYATTVSKRDLRFDLLTRSDQ